MMGKPRSHSSRDLWLTWSMSSTFEAKKMTNQQISVHMEERKWNYRSEFAWFISPSFPNSVFFSLRFYSRVARRPSHHRSSIYSLQSCWSCHVGLRYAPSLVVWRIENLSSSADPEKRQHFVAEEHLDGQISSKTGFVMIVICTQH
jgi:hypothetical protein